VFQDVKKRTGLFGTVAGNKKGSLDDNIRIKNPVKTDTGVNADNKSYKNMFFGAPAMNYKDIAVAEMKTVEVCMYVCVLVLTCVPICVYI
jgi:hypothetical protein